MVSKAVGSTLQLQQLAVRKNAFGRTARASPRLLTNSNSVKPGENNLTEVTVVYDFSQRREVLEYMGKRVFGNPLPTEGMKWTFEKAIKLMHYFIWTNHREQLALLKRCGIK
jgi:hypothetical protein